LIRYDIDLPDLQSNHDLDLVMIYYNLWARHGVEPQIEVSGGRHGVHIAIPGVTLPPIQNWHERLLWDCRGHATFTRVRGADVIFSHKNGKSCLPCADIFEAIDLLRRSRIKRVSRNAYKRRTNFKTED
jgi:hypothetical protein